MLLPLESEGDVGRVGESVKSSSCRLLTEPIAKMARLLSEDGRKDMS